MYLTDYNHRQLIAINEQLRSLRKALADALASGVVSASVSSGGASQSYTRMGVADINRAIAALEANKTRILAGNGRRRTSPNFLP